MRRRTLAAVWIAGALLVSPGGLVAQSTSGADRVVPPAAAPAAHPLRAAAAPTGAASRQARTGDGLEIHALALGGSDPEAVHLSGGALLQIGVGRFSAVGLGMLGRGGDYESTLAGGGLGIRLVRVGALDLTAFGGFAHYAEVGWSGIERSAPGPLFGGIATLRAGGFAIGMAFTDLVGRYDNDDVPEPFSFHVPRISIGLGF